MATQYDPIAKDESLNTTELSPRNIADVLAEELDAIAQAIGGGGGSGGHTIISPDGTSMPQRAGLGFTDAHISDNSGDDETDVSLVQRITDANWALLDPTDPSNNGLYQIGNSPLLHLGYVGNGEKKDLDAGAQSDYVEVVADGVKTWKGLFDELFTNLDLSRVSGSSLMLVDAGTTKVFSIMTRKTDTYCEFTSPEVRNSVYEYGYSHFENNASVRAELKNGTYSDLSSVVQPNGRIIRIYYNDGHTFDFDTKAENCIFDPTGTSLSSTNAEDAIKEVDGKIPSDSGWVQLSAVDGNKMMYRKIGNVVYVAKHTVGTIAANAAVRVGTLPSGYRPLVAFFSGASTQYIQINTDGKIYVRTPTADYMEAWYVSFIADA